jgi:serine/threonine protein phosphatase PrpC
MEPNLESREAMPWGNKPYGETSIGLHRKINQDSFLVTENKFGNTVGLIADGVGDKEDGIIASNYAKEETHRLITEKGEVTQEDIDQIDQKMPEGSSTLILIQEIEKNKFITDSIGDGVVCIIDTNNNTLTEITKKDEVTLIDENGNKVKKLSQYLGNRNLKNPIPLKQKDRITTLLEPHQFLLATSDGFSGYLNHHDPRYKEITSEDVVSLCKKHQNDNELLVLSLIEKAIECGGRDNISIISIPYERV